MSPCSLPLLNSCWVLDRKCGAAGLFWSLTESVYLSVLLCLYAGRQDVRSIWAGGGKSVILTYLLWFQSPHIPTYTFTHPVPAAPLRIGVFHSKTPVVIFSSTSHSFTWNCTFLGKRGVMPLLFHELLSFESETELSLFLFSVNVSWIRYSF